MNAQLGQIMNNKIQKGQKPIVTSEVPGAKAGSCTWSLHTAPPRGWADHLSHPPAWPPDLPLPSPFWGTSSPLLRERARAPVSCFCSIVLQHESHKALPEFLIWPLVNLYWLKSPKPRVCINIIKEDFFLFFLSIKTGRFPLQCVFYVWFTLLLRV